MGAFDVYALVYVWWLFVWLTREHHSRVSVPKVTVALRECEATMLTILSDGKTDSRSVADPLNSDCDDLRQATADQATRQDGGKGK